MKKICLLVLMLIASGGAARAAVNGATSRLIPSNSRTSANGQAQITVGIELRDENGAAVAGKSVALTGSNTSFVFVQPSATDSNGSATGTITCASPAAGEVQGTVDGVVILPNLLKNPSAEVGVSTPTGWLQFANQTITSPNQQFQWSIGGGSNTTRAMSMAISSNSGTTFELSWYQRIQSADLISGTLMTVSALLRPGTDFYYPGPPSGLFLTVNNLNSSNVPVTSSKSVAVTGGTNWVPTALSSVTFPDGATQVEVSLDDVRSTGTAFFENARLALFPSIIFSADLSSPSAITTSSPTLLSAVPGNGNGEVRLSWNAPGNDGMLWPDPGGSYEIRISANFSSLAVSSWTLVSVTFAPANPFNAESLTIRGLTPGTTYQIAIRAIDQAGNKPDFGLTLPVAARNGVSPITVFNVDQNGQKSPMSAKPTFTGTTVSGAAVNVKVDGDGKGKTYSDFSGKWSFTPSTSLSDGPHVGNFQATDANGNTSGAVEFVFQVGSDQPTDDLKPAYPNPARLSQGGGCNFRFSIPSSGVVKLRIFDLNGNEIATVVNQYYDLGTQNIHWDGRTNSGDLAATNSYVALLETDRGKVKRLFSVIR